MAMNVGTGDSDDVRFRPETFLRPAVFEYLRRASVLPRLTLEWWASLLGPRESRLSDFMIRFGSVVPTGLFDNSEIERFLREIFSRRGRTNDFRKLDRELFVVAVDLDSGEACDGGQYAFACTDLGFSGGALTCGAACGATTTSCTP